MMNSRATFQAGAGKRMLFWGFGESEIAGPVGFAFSVLPLLLPICVARMATMPAASTTAPSTSNQRLKRRDDSALWTTFTAIVIVDAEIGVRLGPCRSCQASAWHGISFA